MWLSLRDATKKREPSNMQCNTIGLDLAKRLAGNGQGIAMEEIAELTDKRR